MLSRPDGSGLLGPMLTPPTAIGFEASPNESGDFNNDGMIDVETSNTSSNRLERSVSTNASGP